jgi:hypothetical protein
MEYEEKVNDKGFVYWEHAQTGEIKWENPYYESNEYGEAYPYNDEQYEEDGDWTMYYDENGKRL